MAIALVLNRQRQAALEDSAAFGHVAERFRRAGDHRRAVSLCRDGLRRFPDHVSARVTLGLALVELGEYDQAREALQLALRRAPDNLAAIRGLAHLHDHGGEADPPMQNLWEPPAQEFIEPVARIEPVDCIEPGECIEPVERIEAVAHIEPIERIEPIGRIEPVEPVVPGVPVFARDPELQHYFNALPYAPPLRPEPMTMEMEIEDAMASMDLPVMAEPFIVMAEPTRRALESDFIDFESLDAGLEAIDAFDEGTSEPRNLGTSEPADTMSECPIGRSA